jgi:hypothetical protein
MKPAPPAVLAGEARRAVADRSSGGEWDQPATFAIWTWDGTRLLPRAAAVIDPAFNPDGYPELITSLASRDYAGHEHEPAYAYQLTHEGYGVTPPGPDASPAEVLLHKLDSRTRGYQDRIDRIEVAMALIADVHGRLFTATVYRQLPGQIAEIRFRPGGHPASRITDALITVATVAGHLAYGYPNSPAGTVTRRG